MVAGYFMGDGNDFAWTMNVILPLVLSLVFGRRRLLTRAFGAAGVGACVIGIVGTQSRGGTLGLAAALLFAWLFISRRKMLGLGVLGLVVVGVLFIAPNGYVDRMKSIGDYEQDSSAQGRLQVWGVSMRMALDYPLGVGAGSFGSVYGRFYMPGADENRIAWASNRWLGAHSIYFKVLGEYGYLGLGLLLWLIALNFADNARSGKRAGTLDPVHVLPQWPALLSMSLVGYAVSGIFLGGFFYPHQFLLTGLTLGAMHFMDTIGHAAVSPKTVHRASAPPVRAVARPVPAARAASPSTFRRDPRRPLPPPRPASGRFAR